ncbi:Streptothricin hydrolase [Periweissella ghanensis]|uniref:Streptothricin hydrolase n=2 Tax=Periweissella ghanensis TaxID=467997 RepID=A0ABM8ZAY4_9LACO|nr:cysteine hydrolase family protein [Periweissella ghanensis]CAH0418397.1 Streptothricin hydrolase [Periweissella ghanensis]
MLADALIIIDLQNGVCFDPSQPQEINNLTSLVNAVNTRIEKYWELGKPIIFVQHNDENLLAQSNAWEILSTIDTSNADYYVQKTHANAFYKTNLQDILIAHDVDEIEICGAQTEYCIDTTIKMAHGLGYDVLMKHNLTTTYDNEFMSAPTTVKFYEKIWDGRFVEFFD